MSVVIGLDTGGTFTDVVIYNRLNSEILASAKAVTTHDNLAVGISEALDNLFLKNKELKKLKIDMLCLSTTLATNAVTEGTGGEVALILIGYDKEWKTVEALKRLPKTKIYHINGGHNYYGRKVAPLDKKALLEISKNLDTNIEALAVSSFFSVKNPEHENLAKEILSKKHKLPITLGHQLTGELGADRRAATAALNAGLTSLIFSLIESVKSSMLKHGLKDTSLMVVKGDGTLVSETWAVDRPLETVVSGPAASVVGAKILTGRKSGKDSFWVMDIGGTTTDLAYLDKGTVKINLAGATVSGWQTMVEAAQTRTRGLGGDSYVNIKNGNITLGPRRVLPLCRLAEKYPKVLKILAEQTTEYKFSLDLLGRFFIKGRKAKYKNSDLYEYIKDFIEKGPLDFQTYKEYCIKNKFPFFHEVNSMHDPAFLISSFTPTDALAILGFVEFGNKEASILAGKIFARYFNMTNAEEFAKKVLTEFGRQMAEELLAQSLINEGLEDPLMNNNLVQSLFDKALGRVEIEKHLKVNFTLKDEVVVMGAPAAVFGPLINGLVTKKVVVPNLYQVAGAVGAAAAKVLLKREVSFTKLSDGSTIRVFMPDKIKDYYRMDEAMGETKNYMLKYMEDLGRLAGAKGEIAITYETENKQIVNSQTGSNLILWGTLLKIIFKVESIS